MRSPQPASIVIVCPHCGTRYQLPPEAIGPGGRKVACAHCGKSWLAERPLPLPPPPPDDDRLFSPTDEERLDKTFSAEERAISSQVPAALKSVLKRGETPPPEVARSIAEIKAAIAPKARSATTASAEASSAGSEPAEGKAKPGKPVGGARGKAVAQAQAARETARKLGALIRQRLTSDRSLPTVRLTRVLRVVAVGLLGSVLLGGLLLRGEVVRLIPDLAGLYAAVGLKVNVAGLEFADVSTLVSRRGEETLISVNASIIGLEQRRVAVPPVIVTLLDVEDRPLYQWSVVTRARDLEPGELVNLSTELPSPPADAVRVRLSFAEGLALGSDSPLARVDTPAEHTETAVDPLVPEHDDTAAGHAGAAPDTHEQAAH
ncbi:MAG: zinc-ribbon domain-containing protein [Devosia sp.]|nr:zinc-ribbon domain-containing protein [Devosia sp.]